jgi:hypothetical protein
MFLPRNIDLNQLAGMALSVDPPWTIEVKLILIFFAYSTFQNMHLACEV